MWCAKRSVAAGLVAAAGLAWAAVAGPLGPSAGPVAPTMKTLTEVEPRTPVGDSTTPGTAQSRYRITQPGSYYLTGNVSVVGKNAIEIVASNVTLDLNGFTLSGSGANAGVLAGNVVDGVVVRNGIVENFSAGGVALATSNLVGLKNIRVEGVRALNCLIGVSVGDASQVEDCRTTGCSSGVSAGSGSTVTGCVAIGANNIGIRLNSDGIIQECTASGCVTGFQVNGDSVIRDSVATGCTSSGITLAGGGVAERCLAMDSGTGIITGVNCRVVECTAVRNGSDGISVFSGCVVEGNMARENGVTAADGAGVATRAGALGCRIAHNTVASNDRGIRVMGTNNYVVSNTAISNGTNYVIDANNRVGQVLLAPASAAINGSSGGGIGSTDPMMNLAAN